MHPRVAPSWLEWRCSRRNSLSEMGVPVMRGGLRALEKQNDPCHGVPTLRRRSLTLCDQTGYSPPNTALCSDFGRKTRRKLLFLAGKIQGISWPISSTTDVFGPVFLSHSVYADLHVMLPCDWCAGYAQGCPLAGETLFTTASWSPQALGRPSQSIGH